jgi:hypothetical protein
MDTGVTQRFYVDGNISIPQPVTICYPDEIACLSLVIESRVYDTGLDEFDGIVRFRRVHPADVQSVTQLKGITANLSTLGDTIDVEFEDHVILTPQNK